MRYLYGTLMLSIVQIRTLKVGRQYFFESGLRK